MLNLLRTTAVFAAVAATSLMAAPNRTEAQTYQIDCAILLCLSGGWPASVPCTRARAEFIRRITPWPIEPPLQIWRCPMGAAFEVDPSQLDTQRFYDIAMERTAPELSYPSDPLPDFDLTALPAVMRFSGGNAARLPEETMLQLIQDYSDDNGQADIDISGAEFNFVRSIRVFNIQARQYESGSEGDCNRYASVRLGTYGTQGDYRWNRSDVAAIPAAHVGLDRYGDNCPSVSNRSVFIDWRDYEGNYGYEQVNY